MKVWANPDKLLEGANGELVHVKDVVYHPGPPIKRFGEDGTSNWPKDQFTGRRVRDGDVFLSDPNLTATNMQVDAHGTFVVAEPKRIDGSKPRRS